MSDDRIEQIRERAAAATPGPWGEFDGNEGIRERGPMWMVANDEFHNPGPDPDAPWLAVEIHVGVKEDAEFIAHARTDLPFLLAEYDRLQGLVDKQMWLILDLQRSAR